MTPRHDFCNEQELSSIRCCSSRQEWSQRKSSHHDLSQSDFFEAEFNSFCANSFNLKNILAPSVFEKDVMSRVFSYICKMPQYAFLEKYKILVRELNIPKPPQTGTLSAVTFDSSRWVYPNAVMTTPPDFSPIKFRTTIKTDMGELFYHHLLV